MHPVVRAPGRAQPWLSALLALCLLGAPVGVGLAADGAEPDLSQRIARVEADLEVVRRELRAAEDIAVAEAEAQRTALRRLVDILERTGSVLRIAGELRNARRETQARPVMAPGALLSGQPPFPVPLLDAVSASWRAQRQQAERLERLLRDTRAMVVSSGRSLEAAERERRRAKEALEKSADAVEEAQRRAALRERELASRILAAERRLAEVQVEAAMLELEVQREAQRQAEAARDWVRAHLEPAAKDLHDTLAALAKRGFEVERSLESTRLDLAAANGRLAAAQARADRAAQSATPDPEAAAEVSARRLEFTSAQRRVVLLGERLARLDSIRKGWERRYAVLAGAISAEDAQAWLNEVAGQLEALDRQRRINEARRGELQADLDERRGEILQTMSRAQASSAPALPWLRLEETELQILVQLYRQDVASLDEALGLLGQLREELAEWDRSLPLTERLGRFGSSLRELWLYELTSSADSPITVGKILTALGIIALGWLVIGRLGALVVGLLLRRIGFEQGAVTAFQALFFYASIAAVFLVALRVVNIPLTAFAVLGGALALGIGFGSQTVVSNFISGVILLVERPIKTGDHVEVDGVYGQVEQIGLRSTRIRSGDNFHIIVPNASFLERSVVNWTHANTQVRLRILVGVAYGSDTRFVASKLLEVLDQQAEVMRQPPPTVLFKDFADSALVFELRLFITVRDLLDKPRIESDIRFGIDAAFREAGITIAYPQRDLHIDSLKPIEVKLTPS